MKTTSRSFELAFQPNVALISVVRRFVTAFYDQIVADSDATSRVALATHELLENAVKYSSDGGTRLRIEVDDSTRALTVTTSNRASSEHVKHLRQAFAEMDRASDPAAFFQLAMLRTSTEELGSGLGLARIFAEAEMSMRLEVDSDRVVIVACAQIAEVVS